MIGKSKHVQSWMYLLGVELLWVLNMGGCCVLVLAKQLGVDVDGGCRKRTFDGAWGRVGIGSARVVVSAVLRAAVYGAGWACFNLVSLTLLIV